MPNAIRNVPKQQELIDKIPYLKDFHRDDKKTLAEMGYFLEFEPEEIVITENTPNQELFFLIKGEVEILKGNESIVKLRGGGRLFGEMSYMNHSFTTASVRANTEIVMLAFKIPGLLGLDLERHARLQVSLYKAIAEILAEKLMATTQLAQSYQQIKHDDGL